MSPADSLLPQGFVPLIAPLLQAELGDFLASYEQPPTRGIRYSTRRANPVHPWCGQAIPWARNAFYLTPGAQPGPHPLHWAGAYYIQEPSAMVPAAVLAPQPGDKVLDLCAAPGGKATQMAGMMGGEGLLIANDPVLARAQELSRNMERMGVSNCVVLSNSPERLAAAFPHTFDRVLVDAPCSGEGMFRKDPASRAHWHPALPEQNSLRQRAILDQAARMLKPGGRLVYSTCTFNRQENEEVIAGFLKSHPGFRLLPFCLPGLPEAQEGMLRLWPHRIMGEGHFVALLLKEEGPIAAKFPEKNRGPEPLPQALRKEVQDALSDWVFEGPDANGQWGQTLVHLPPGCPSLLGLKVLRAGLHLAVRVGKTLRPDHALALAAQPRKTMEITVEEADAYRQGAVLEDASGRLAGFVAPTLSGWPLGWGKAAGGMVKNHYPKGLRKFTSQED